MSLVGVLEIWKQRIRRLSRFVVWSDDADVSRIVPSGLLQRRGRWGDRDWQWMEADAFLWGQACSPIKANRRLVYFIPFLESTQHRPAQGVRTPRKNQENGLIVETSSSVCVLCSSTRA